MGIYPSKKPKFSQHRGRTWDSIPIYLPNGKVIDGFLDTTWGFWIHFELDGKWKRISVDNIESSSWKVILDKDN